MVYIKIIYSLRFSRVATVAVTRVAMFSRVARIYKVA